MARFWFSGLQRGRAIAIAVGSLIAACGGVSIDPLQKGKGKRADAGAERRCVVGQERCDCSEAGQCNAGLTCASDICVALPHNQSNGGSTSGGGRGGASPPDAAQTGSGGKRAGAGGAPSTGGKKATGGFTVVDSGASGGVTMDAASETGGAPSSDASLCLAGQKFCGGLCTPPAPRVGCALTGCDPCSLSPPANGYITCNVGQCVFDCLSGFTKNGNRCEGSGAGGGGSGTCGPQSCPACDVIKGPACCTSAGKCGCPLIPYVAPTCQ